MMHRVNEQRGSKCSSSSHQATQTSSIEGAEEEEEKEYSFTQRMPSAQWTIITEVICRASFRVEVIE